MKLLAAVVLCISLPGVLKAEAEPKFEFALSPRTQKHIAIQPQADHHRIYFPIRILNAKGCRAFARVRTVAVGQGEFSTQQVISEIVFDVGTNNDLKAVYLRAPRFSTQAAVYQVEVGTIRAAEIDSHHVHQAFAWEVRRDPQGQASFVHDRPEGGIVSLGIHSRMVVVTGGEMKIKLVPVALTPASLQFGEDRSGDQLLITGEEMAREIPTF